MKKEIENHYHCSECGHILKEIGRIGFIDSGNGGVVIIYQCSKHIWVWEEKDNKLKKIY